MAIDLQAGLHAAASERLTATVDAALDTLHKESLDDRDVHDARRWLEKARAALRLLRPAWGENRYHTENQALRDAGRCLPSRISAGTRLAALRIDHRRTSPCPRRARSSKERRSPSSSRTVSSRWS